MNIEEIKRHMKEADIDIAILQNDLDKCLKELKNTYGLVDEEEITERLAALQKRDDKLSAQIEELLTETQKNYWC